MLAPVAGAAGGALAITVAAERFGAQRGVAAIGGAAISLVAAANTRGVVRDVFMGAAMAGVCLGVVEMVRSLRPNFIFGDQPEPPQMRQAAPPDAITRADLETAVAALVAKHQAELIERDKTHAAQVRELESMVRSLIGQVREARAPERSNQWSAEPRRGDAANDNEVAEASAEESSCDAFGEGAETESAREPMTLSSEQITQLQAVYSLLDANERVQLSALMANLPKDALVNAQSHLLQLTPGEAAGYLRREIFPSMRALA